MFGRVGIIIFGPKSDKLFRRYPQCRSETIKFLNLFEIGFYIKTVDDKVKANRKFLFSLGVVGFYLFKLYT